MRALLLVTTLLLSGFALAANVEQHEMQPLSLNGYDLLDAEYLPFIGEDALRYPDDVLFGFYAFGSTQEAQACALRAYRQIKAFFTEDPEELQGAVEAGATPFFYLWIDDYSVADANRTRRTARLWHWNQEGRDYTNGYWKWEAVLTQNGTCILPYRDQVLEALQRAVDDLSFVGKSRR